MPEDEIKLQVARIDERLKAMEVRLQRLEWLAYTAITTGIVGIFIEALTRKP